ncbi:hypothetical protein [Nitrosospira lacus]|uniref:hypothetical protein n=1 Tax=Nitrosospira lacus TaxID=1288494 RepID=UPI0006856F33|nr:hypothetical protein [Nitrosospira lacus]
MSQILLSSLQSSVSLPALFAPTADASKRFIEFFTANIRNPNTRKAYPWAVGEFAAWCEVNGLTELSDIEPVHVAAYIEILWQRLSAPSVNRKATFGRDPDAVRLAGGGSNSCHKSREFCARTQAFSQKRKDTGSGCR